MLMDAPYVDVAVLCIGESTPRYYRYERDEDFEADILLKCIFFWNNHVLGESPPSTDELVCEELPTGTESKIQSDMDTLAAVSEYAELKKFQKYMGEQEERLKKQILSYMGNFDYLTDLKGKTVASFTSQVRTTFDSITFKAENSELYTKYIKKSDPIRILKLIADKKEEI